MLKEIDNAFKYSIHDGIKHIGKMLGYDGICSDGCGCTFDDFPACGDICNDAMFGYIATNSDCKNSKGFCVSVDGCCPEYCEGWEQKVVNE